MEQNALLEIRAGGLDDVSEFNMEIYDIQEIDSVSHRINSEVFSLNHLAEDDEYGDMDDRDGNY